MALLSLLSACSLEQEKESTALPDIPKMRYYAGGELMMGKNLAPEVLIEVEERLVEVAPFYLDSFPVTVADFRAFVKATGYKTKAEEFGDAAVFDTTSGNWEMVIGANWQFPQGKELGPAPDNHPVTQVSYYDALAYAKWKGKRLPTEEEWEFAARYGNSSDDLYSWGGKELVLNGKYQANTWQGNFPEFNTNADGYVFTAPVGRTGISKSGPTDMGGNIWQWTSSPFLPEPALPDTGAMVLKGGSFLCDPKNCHGFQISAKTYCTKETALMHTGFRCATSPKKSNND